jgi:hypothetical protein
MVLTDQETIVIEKILFLIVPKRRGQDKTHIATKGTTSLGQKGKQQEKWRRACVLIPAGRNRQDKIERFSIV